MQQFQVRYGEKYPHHPEPPYRFSDFPQSHRGCYYCGGQHTFNDSQKKRENGALCCMRFNMYCHQPRMYFKYQQRDGRPGGNGDTQVQFNTQSNRLSQYELHEQKKQSREEEIRGNGFGRGNRSTLSAWLQGGNLCSLFIQQQQNSQYRSPGSNIRSHTPGCDSRSHTLGLDSRSQY